jgi:hypothetical protein
MSLMTETDAYIRQEDENGCGVAALGIVMHLTSPVRWTYRMWRGYFPEMRSQGLSEVEVCHFLNGQGFWYRRWWISAAPMPAPGRLALVLVDDGHWIVVKHEYFPDAVSHRWGVFDPARPEPKAIADYTILKWIELLPLVSRADP